MADLDAIVRKAEDAAARRIAFEASGHAAEAPLYLDDARAALNATGFRELVEALMPFAEAHSEEATEDQPSDTPVTMSTRRMAYYGLTLTDLRRAAAVIAKLEAGNAASE